LNLYGRLDRLFLKLYEVERELPVTVFLDASESMTFANRAVRFRAASGRRGRLRRFVRLRPRERDDFPTCFR
jgi:uncharacterized protein (DUF58 family)